MSDNEKETFINITMLLEQCVKLAIEACKITSECYQNNNIKQFEKGCNDFVTEADFKIQTMIVKGLTKVWPTLRIVGEEETEFQGQIDLDYDNLSAIKFPEAVNFNQKYQIQDLCVWVDPIDNTRGFLQGEAEAVTNLIGISHKNHAALGIIGVPFKQSDGQSIFNPSVIIGSVESKFCFEYWIDKKEWKSLSPRQRQENYIPKITMSPTRKNIIETDITDTLKGEKILAGGAGYKTLLVANGTADLLAYCESFTRKWDSCAGHAIIEAMGGFFYDQKGDEIIYDPDEEYLNREGLLCGFNEDYKKTAIEIFIKHKNNMA